MLEALAGEQATRSGPASASLTVDLGDQGLELHDPAGPADARADDIALGADFLVVWLEVEAAVEIQALAIIVEVGADELAAAQDEVDAVGAGKERAGKRVGGDALGSLFLVPTNAKARMRSDGDADDQPLLDGHDPHALPRHGGDRAVREQCGQQPDQAG